MGFCELYVTTQGETGHKPLENQNELWVADDELGIICQIIFTELHDLKGQTYFKIHDSHF